MRWTEVNPNLELALDRGRARDPRGALPLELLETLDTRHGAAANSKFVGAWESLRATQVRPECYQNALELVSELEADAPKMLDRCRVRHAIADYLERELVPYALRDRDDAGAGEFGRLAWKLRDARPIGAYGVDTFADEPGAENFFDPDYVAPSRWARREKWANRAGLVKLCPDDARAEAQRASKLYGQRIAELDAQGHVLRSAVFTLPNFPQWHLAAGVDTIFERFKQTILYARHDGKVARSIRDKKRKFPDLVGAWGCLEAPLSGRFGDGDRSNAWNVHVNLLLVFKPSEQLTSYRIVDGVAVPDYSPIHDAWGAGIKWREIKQGDRDAMRHAILELVKYPLQTVATKSAKDRRRKHDANGNELTPAPPMIEWPAECFAEWWRAHKGFRRARSWGTLYAGSLPDPLDRSDAGTDWLGVVRVSPAGVDVVPPSLSTVADDARRRSLTFTHRALLSIDPGYRDAVAKRDSDAFRREVNECARDRARARLFLIQGNKSAELNATPTTKAAIFARKNDPPDTG